MKCVFDHGIKCVALTEKRCEGCRFKKTQKEVEAGRKKAKRRINSLPEEQQKFIRETYHRKGKIWEQI